MLTAAVLISASLLLSRLLGLARVAVFAGIYGTGAGFKEYNAAFRIPDILFTLVAGGALGSAFIPVFAGLLERRHDDDAWKVANTVLNTALVVMTSLAIVAFVLAPTLSRILNPGFSDDQVTQTADLTRIMLVQPVLLGIGGIFAAIQNSYQRFLLPAIAPLVYNLSIVAGAALFGEQAGVYAAAWAVVIGAFLMFEIQIWGVSLESVRYRLNINWRMSEARDVLRLMLPRLLGLSSYQLMLIVTFWLASSLTSARNNAITYAWTLVMFPVGAVGTSLGVAVFPTISRHAAVSQTHEVERIVREGLRAVLFLAVPATAGILILCSPIVRLLFDHGAWTSGSTAATTYALLFYAFCIPPLAAIEICTRSFYALQDTRTPVAIASTAAGVDAVLCILFFHLFGSTRAQGGLGLGTALAVWLQVGLLLLALRRRLPDLLNVDLRRAAARVVLATATMSLCVYAASVVVDRAAPGPLVVRSFLICLVAVAVGAVIYGVMASLLHLREVNRFLRIAGRLAGDRNP